MTLSLNRIVCHSLSACIHILRIQKGSRNPSLYYTAGVISSSLSQHEERSEAKQALTAKALLLKDDILHCANVSRACLNNIVSGKKSVELYNNNAFSFLLNVKAVSLNLQH